MVTNQEGGSEIGLETPGNTRFLAKLNSSSFATVTLPFLVIVVCSLTLAIVGLFTVYAYILIGQFLVVCLLAGGFFVYFLKENPDSPKNVGYLLELQRMEQLGHKGSKLDVEEAEYALAEPKQVEQKEMKKIRKTKT